MFDPWLSNPLVPFVMASVYTCCLLALFPVFDASPREWVRALNVFVTQAVVAAVLLTGPTDAFEIANPHVQLALYISVGWLFAALITPIAHEA